MANNDEEKQRERLELLKMKQGLIEESELIPEDVEDEPAPEMNAFQKVQNFFYYYKWTLVIVAAALIVVGFLVGQTIFREKPDIEVLVIGTDYETDIIGYSAQIEQAIEKYCPDVNGNGKIHAAVITIDLAAAETSGQYYITQMQMFDRELTGSACIVISTADFLSYMTNEVGASADVFADLAAPSADSPQYSVAVKDTALSEALSGIADKAHVYLLTKGRGGEVVAPAVETMNALTGRTITVDIPENAVF